MEIELRLKNVIDLEEYSLKITTSAPSECDLKRWAYEICINPPRKNYPAPSCFPDHIMFVKATENVTRLYGLKVGPKLPSKRIELLELFCKHFEEDRKVFDVSCRCDLCQMDVYGEDIQYQVGGTLFYGCFHHVVDPSYKSSAHVFHGGFKDVYREVPQQPNLSSTQIPDSVKGMAKQAGGESSVLVTHPVESSGHAYQHQPAYSNVASLQETIYNNQATDLCISNNEAKAIVAVCQDGQHNPVFPIGVVISPNLHPSENLAIQTYLSETKKVVGFPEQVKASESCPFLGDKPDELSCYGHALNIIYNIVTPSGCPEHCREYLRPYIAEVENEVKVMNVSTASERMKEFIRQHCQHCSLKGCPVPHIAAGCCMPGFLSATATKSTSCFPPETGSTADLSHRSHVASPDLEAHVTSSSHSPFFGKGIHKVIGSVSFDPAPLQNSSASVNFFNAPIPVQDNRDLNNNYLHPCGPICPVEDEVPGPRVYLEMPQGGRAAHINQLLLNSQEDLPHNIRSFLKGTVIFAAKGTPNIMDMQHIFITGSCNDWVPDFLMDPCGSTFLGKGGNGITFKYTLSNTDFAVKETTYRRNEVRLWKNFDHPNIVPLLAVVSVNRGRCLQFMPLLDCSLRDEMNAIKSLKDLQLKENEHYMKFTVLPNIRHILRSTLTALRYLHVDCHVLHSDLKPHNILILKEGHSNHPHMFCCPCTHKYTIKLCDFDSARECTATTVCCPRESITLKSDEELSKLLGTKGFRAPELFIKLDYQQNPSALGTTIEGPWCDIWSFGSCIVFICLGPSEHKDHKDAMSFMFAKNSAETGELMIKITELSASESGMVKDLAHFAAKCLQPLPHNRPSAQALLNHSFLSEVSC